MNNKLFYTQLLILAIGLIGALCLSARESDVLNAPVVLSLQETPGVTLNQPEALTARLTKTTESESDINGASNTQGAKTSSKTGHYRVEVYSDNTRQAKSHASARVNNLVNRFPQYNTQLVFDSPFWRVKVGPFSSRSDAEAAMAEIRSAFPAYAPYLRIVRN